jgi:hypothetical protein
MRQLKRLISILAGGALGLFLLIFGCKEYLETRSLQSKGKATTGEVTDAEERSGRRGRRKYYLSVTFRTEQAQEVNSRAQVSRAVYDQASHSRKVNVTYLPTKPDVHRLGPEVKSDFINIGIGVLVLGFAGYSAVRGGGSEV